MLIAIAAAALAFAAQPAGTPRQPRIMIPPMALDAEDWALRRVPGSCAVTVALSRGARLVLAYHGGQNLAVMNLADPALGLTAGSGGQALVRFGSFPEEAVEAQVLAIPTQAGTPVLALAAIRSTGRLRLLAEAGSITVSFGGHAPVTHAVPGAREGVRSLIACAEEARAALPEAERGPRVTLNSYFSTNDYPSAALRDHEQGTVRFWLGISAEGRVSDCHIIQSSGSRALDETTCRILRERGRYRPARNMRGQPIASFDGDYAVTWRLP